MEKKYTKEEVYEKKYTQAQLDNFLQSNSIYYKDINKNVLITGAMVSLLAVGFGYTFGRSTGRGETGRQNRKVDIIAINDGKINIYKNKELSMSEIMPNNEFGDNADIHVLDSKNWLIFIDASKHKEYDKTAEIIAVYNISLTDDNTIIYRGYPYSDYSQYYYRIGDDETWYTEAQVKEFLNQENNVRTNSK